MWPSLLLTLNQYHAVCLCDSGRMVSGTGDGVSCCALVVVSVCRGPAVQTMLVVKVTLPQATELQREL